MTFIPNSLLSGWQAYLLNKSQIVGFIAILLFLAFPWRWSPVQGVSMSPTFNDGEVVCFRLMRFGQAPSLDSVVVFESPVKLGELYIKRLVGLPGDELVFAQGYFFRNGQLVDLPDGSLDLKVDLAISVPEGMFFAIGDYAEMSLDSRQLGPIELDRLVGEVISEQNN